MSDLQNRFTARARQVMERASQEAIRFNHEYIGTEHVLLALAEDNESTAGRVLEKLGSRRQICLAVERIIRKGPVMVTMGSLPQTFQTKMAIYFAMEEARELNHNYVGTEHILLGLFHEQSGVAACVLLLQGLKVEKVRQEVLSSLEGGGKDTGSPRRQADENQGAVLPRRAEPLLISKPYAPGAKWGRPPVGRIIHALAWLVLAAGIVGVAMGVTKDPKLTLPGAVLVGSGLVALALGRR